MSDLSPREVAAELGLSRSAVYRLIEDGEIAAYKARGRLRVERAELQAFKQRNRVKPRARPDRPMFEPTYDAGPPAEVRFRSDLRATKGAA